MQKLTTMPCAWPPQEASPFATPCTPLLPTLSPYGFADALKPPNHADPLPSLLQQLRWPVDGPRTSQVGSSATSESSNTSLGAPSNPSTTSNQEVAWKWKRRPSCLVTLRLSLRSPCGMCHQEQTNPCRDHSFRARFYLHLSSMIAFEWAQSLF